jgi:glycolate oxidase iron-sulfur subunit|tara:strand:- start:733 stop:1083 length:351 start_codon:yes stop_codon:yes gene_type:complete
MAKKIDEQDLIEANNLLEEASSVFDTCTRCGMCKDLCPSFKVLKDEASSGRGHAILLSDRVLDKVIYECTLCQACERKCPLNIKICDAVLKAREAMVLKGKGLKSDLEMRNKVLKG